MHDLAHFDGREYITIVLQYILERGEINDPNEFFRIIDTQISPEVGEDIMSLASQLKKEGLEEGRKEGRQVGRQEERIELARRMLEEGSSSAFVIKVTGLSVEQIKELQKH